MKTEGHAFTIRVGIVGANTKAGWAKVSHVPAINGLPAVKLAPQPLQTKRCSGFRVPVRPTGVPVVLPLRFVSSDLHDGHLTRRFEPPSTSASGRFGDV